MNSGDYVVCVNTNGVGDTNLVLDKMYIIDFIRNNFIHLKGQGVSGWYPHRFRLATPEEVEYVNFPNKMEEVINV